MIITKIYLNKHLQCDMDFADFYLLDIVHLRNKSVLIFLAPKRSEADYSYFVMKGSTESKYFSNLNNLLAAAVSAKFITACKASAIRRYYMRLIKKINRRHKS